MNLLAAIIVAVLVDVISPTAFTNAEQYFLGLLIFTVLTLAEMLYVSQDVQKQVAAAVEVRQEEMRAWEARNELDRKIQEVQRLFHQLDVDSHNSTDLFYEYHKKKLGELERSLRDACVKQQTPIDETMFSVTSWLLDSSFHGRDGDILRAVLPTKDLNFFFDVHTRMYFTQMWDLVTKGVSKGVRRLIVVDDPAHLEDERLKRLVAFHNSMTAYACRAIERSHFDRIVTDYRLQHLVVDFGIYGTSYLYKGLTNGQDEIVGIYSKDAAEIAEFTNCFQSCWDAAYDLESSVSATRPVALTTDWLFRSSAQRQEASQEAPLTTPRDQLAGQDEHS